jgi:hypothetical protein
MHMGEFMAEAVKICTSIDGQKIDAVLNFADREG